MREQRANRFQAAPDGLTIGVATFKVAPCTPRIDSA